MKAKHKPLHSLQTLQVQFLETQIYFGTVYIDKNTKDSHNVKNILLIFLALDGICFLYNSNIVPRRRRRSSREKIGLMVLRDSNVKKVSAPLSNRTAGREGSRAQQMTKDKMQNLETEQYILYFSSLFI